MKGCPSQAIYRHSVTEAVIIDETKCIGCFYCQWNCPYGAPKSGLKEKVAEKCNLCTNLVRDGKKPACASGCPTGALNFGIISDGPEKIPLPWFPESPLDPSIEITRTGKDVNLQIVPEGKFATEIPCENPTSRDTSSDWSLTGFTFLSAISVSLYISDFLNGTSRFNLISLFLIIIAGIISIFHLGTRTRAWRAVLNLFRSPLSLEITTYLIYLISLILSGGSQNGFISLITIFSGMGLMLAIDAVYTFPLNNNGIKFHSGQTFLTALLMISFFSGLAYQFLFLALIKLFLSFAAILRNGNRHWSFGLRFLRILMLIVSIWAIFTMQETIENFIYLLFLTGELADRVLFYADFEPVAITKLINDNIARKLNEKKRG